LDADNGYGFSPELMYAIAWRESIRGQIEGLWPLANAVVATDNGCGLCQVTPADWWTSDLHAAWNAIDWRNPYANTKFAIEYFALPAEEYWSRYQQMQGVDLARCIAAEYNCGRGLALDGHKSGNVDLHTTGGDYAADVALNYTRLVNKIKPL
jgi:hypothetical protein